MPAHSSPLSISYDQLLALGAYLLFDHKPNNNNKYRVQVGSLNPSQWCAEMFHTKYKCVIATEENVYNGNNLIN